MSRPSRRRPSEVFLGWLVRDRAALEGVLGDLREEAGRGWRYDLAVLSLAPSYLGERVRDRPVAGVIHDLRFAARALWRRPAQAAAVVGTLGLGFGAAAAVLSIAYGVWLRPLAFRDPDRLLRAYEVRIARPEAPAEDAGADAAAPDRAALPRSRVSPPLGEDVRLHDWDSMTGLATVSGDIYDWRRGDGRVERVQATVASRGVFDVLGLEPLHGRLFSPTPGAREVVLGESFWHARFGADYSVVGSIFELDGQSYEVVGVVADGLPYPEGRGEIWLPYEPAGVELSEGMRGARYLDMIGRLRPGHTLAEADAELDAFLRGLAGEHPQAVGWSAIAVSLHDDLVRPFLHVLRVLVLSAVLFLLIACANVAGLVAARRIRDRPEREVRLALGASPGRVLRQDAIEMLLVASAGALVATMAAGWVLAPLRALAPEDLPRVAEIQPDPVVLGLAAVAVLAAGLLISALGGGVAAREIRPATSRRGATARTAGRSSLVVAQVALTTLLLAGGVALAAHFVDLGRVEAGFDPDGVLSAQIMLQPERYATSEDRAAFHDGLIAELARRGHEVAHGMNPPMAGASMRFGYRPSADAEQDWGQYHSVSSGYLDLLGIELLSGRGFDERDTATSPPVVVINQTLARAHFTGDPVGREMVVVGAPREIVGVVADTRHFGPDRVAPAEMYVPMAQDAYTVGHLLIRPRGSLGGAELAEVLASLDPTVPAPALTPYADHVSRWFAPLRFQLMIVGLLAAVGTCLALVGLHALVAYLVASRRREIGIRLALGETSGGVFLRVLARGLALTVVGIALGGIALQLLGGTAAALIGIDLTHPEALVPVAALITAAALLSSARPARRASRVDPAVTLRED